MHASQYKVCNVYGVAALYSKNTSGRGVVSLKFQNIAKNTFDIFWPNVWMSL